MNLTIAHLSAWYNEYKKRVFDNDMPSVSFKLDKTRQRLGRAQHNCNTYAINISTFWERNEEQYRNTLLHEMCHILCYYHGHYGEHHTGYYWKEISNKAYRITGLYIQRCEDITGWKPASSSIAPSIIVDIEYNDHHFIVKTTKEVVRRDINSSWLRNRPIKVYISDNPAFVGWSCSRSLNRGYKFDTFRYEKEIVPLISKAVKVENANHLFWGQYDFLGIR